MMAILMIAPWLNFVAVLLLTLGLVCAALIVLMARTLLRPRRMNDARATWILQRLSPMDLGLEFEPIGFTVRDQRTGGQLKIAAWWIPFAGSTRTMLLIHGYADAKVGAIAWAPTLHSMGWNILAIDLRAHGESEGVYSTAGFYEREDVNQVINQFRAARTRESGTLAIFGVSLGGAVAVATAAARDDIAAVILESPFADYRRAVSSHGRMRGLPEGILRDAAIRMAEWISAADFRAVRPEALIAQVKCPVMLIHAGNDPFIPDDDARAMEAALGARNNPNDMRWSIESAGHVLGLVADAEEYRRRIEAFLRGTGASPVQSTNGQHERGAHAT